MLEKISVNRFAACAFLSWQRSAVSVQLAFVIPHLAILCTADDTSSAIAGDLLRFDWLGRVRKLG